MRGDTPEVQEINQKIREAFSILSQGVEMVQFDTIRGAGLAPSTLAHPVKRTVWMDSDILRICSAAMRPTIVDRAVGKVAPGLYMRDVAEVREGDGSLDFRLSPTPPLDRDKCLAVVGSERTLCFEMPSKFARDWFLERFRLVVGDILTDDEKRSRVYCQPVVYQRLPRPEVESADHLLSILVRGMQILHHHPNGSVVKSVLSFDEGKKCLLVTSTERGSGGFFGINASKVPMVVAVTDVSEVRSGSHSIGFVRTSSTDKGGESFSIISSGTPMDLQVSSLATRDMLVDKLRVFVRKFKMAALPTTAQEQQPQRQGQGSSSSGGGGGVGGSGLSSLEAAAAGAIASLAGGGMAGGMAGGMTRPSVGGREAGAAGGAGGRMGMR